MRAKTSGKEKLSACTTAASAVFSSVGENQIRKCGEFFRRFSGLQQGSSTTCGNV